MQSFRHVIRRSFYHEGVERRLRIKPYRGVIGSGVGLGSVLFAGTVTPRLRQQRSVLLPSAGTDQHRGTALYIATSRLVGHFGSNPHEREVADGSRCRTAGTTQPLYRTSVLHAVDVTGLDTSTRLAFVPKNRKQERIRQVVNRRFRGPSPGFWSLGFSRPSRREAPGAGAGRRRPCRVGEKAPSSCG